MNFALGMLFCVSAMAYTFIFVPDSRPIRDARIAKMALNSNAAAAGGTEKPIEDRAAEEVNSEYKLGTHSDTKSNFLFKPLIRKISILSSKN